jgi:hypothetical protein
MNGRLKVGSLAKKLKEEMEKLTWAHIWQSDNDINWVCKMFKERYSNIEEQNLF